MLIKYRFKVPFELDIENKKSAILGKENANIVFKFKDENGKYKVLNRDKLEDIDILSQGEKRALYLLQMIFEIENRVRNNVKTLFIVDDIADSFDYKNKYAIIEYLKELPTKASNFYQIILTHNFDFFRTVQERILTNVYKREYSFIAQKNDGGILLLKAGDKNVVSPFIYWKIQLKSNVTNYKFLIAMIPFIRELISCTARNDRYFDILTSLLHVKADTKTITISTIKEIYKDVLGIDLGEEDICIFDKMYAIANDISKSDDTEDDTLNLENKVILSIATRLMAEYYMQSCDIVLEDKIGDTFDKFKKQFLQDNTKSEIISLLEQVVIMTPENIHLNSFMYEPILDMSDWHLRKLYQNILRLNSTNE